MTHADFHRAILDEPDDDLVRLAFADWLEEHDEGDRAAWMRLSIDLDRARATDAPCEELFRRTRAAFVRCRPVFAKPPGRPFGTDRGMLCYVPDRLDELSVRDRWPRKAVAAGWLHCVDLYDTYNLVQRVVTAWTGNWAGVPLQITSATLLSEENLSALLAIPELDEIRLDPHKFSETTGVSLQNSAVRGIRIDLSFVNNADVDTGFRRIRWPRTVRRIRIDGRWNVHYPPCPTDTDIARLEGHPTLRHLRLVNCLAVTAEGVAELIAATPGLMVTHE